MVNSMTVSWQSHDGLLAEPCQTPGRAMMDFSQTQAAYFYISKTKQKGENKVNIYDGEGGGVLNCIAITITIILFIKFFLQVKGGPDKVDKFLCV